MRLQTAIFIIIHRKGREMSTLENCARGATYLGYAITNEICDIAVRTLCINYMAHTNDDINPYAIPQQFILICNILLPIFLFR